MHTKRSNKQGKLFESCLSGKMVEEKFEKFSENLKNETKNHKNQKYWEKLKYFEIKKAKIRKTYWKHAFALAEYQHGNICIVIDGVKFKIHI